MKRIVITFVFCILMSCGFGVSEEEELINGYYIGWFDLESNRNIFIKDPTNPNIGEVIIESYVYAVGFDDQYIIAKTIPSLSNTDFKAYYILNTKRKNNTNTDKHNLQVYYNENEFNAQLTKQGLDNIEFSLNYNTKPF